MKKTIFTLVVLVILVVLGFLVFGKKKDNSPKNNQNQTQNSTQNSNNNTQGTPDSTGNSISGILKLSNSSAKGNLMLQTDNQVLYLRTSRDFSALIGKKVTVSYDGTLTDFTLLNITAAE